MGLGDVKLAGAVGLLMGCYGWPGVLQATILTVALGGLAALGLLARGARRHDDLAYGPAIVLGALLAVTIN